ncbi:hypothetical protein MtrunA17_Chr3g0094821 [Medicago truncatula]|uniref:Uncharacterized protein n=1 Tax=Medicago truncatula TaxID=3880 RepID=A0A396IN61_MEDTR|nr:hypothetical protein MtrunA17_Chr3g0094821 [Medicago truncatula]
MLLYTIVARLDYHGSSAIEENKLNETPSCDSAELKRDEAMKLLKGVLHLKPIVLEELSLSSSDFPGYHVIDLKPLRGGSLKQREEFFEIEKWLENGTNLASFQKSIPPSKPMPKPMPSTDSFSAHEIDSFFFFFFLGGGRGLNPGSCIYYELSLPTELSIRRP